MKYNLLVKHNCFKIQRGKQAKKRRDRDEERKKKLKEKKISRMKGKTIK
jgi:hypothetical protein